MPINIKFTNRNTSEDGIRVYRSPDPFTSGNLPVVHDVLAPGASAYTDSTVQRGQNYYYMFEAFRDSDSAFSELLATAALPVLSGPGPQAMAAGDSVNGWYGETLESDLFTASDLSTALGLTSGTLLNLSHAWLKFNRCGKTLFIAKKFLRYNLSWDNINAVGAVYGIAIAKNGGDLYLVRLMKGGNVDPLPAANTTYFAGSEWDDLFYKIHPDGGVATPWASYTYDDLAITATYQRTLCQETSEASTTNSLYRGANAALTFGAVAAKSAVSTAQGWRPVLEFIPPLPGNQVLTAGTMAAGWFGEVSTTDLISGDSLATAVGITTGTAQNVTEPWLKFAYKNKILFVAKKTFRYSVPWSTLNTLGLVAGTARVTIGKHIFKVRLLKGGDADPATAAGGEWNDLIYKIHTSDPTATHWATYTNTDLGISSSAGGATWCQEVASANSGNRVFRGGSAGLTNFNNVISTSTATVYGWRPVLELVGQV